MKKEQTQRKHIEPRLEHILPIFIKRKLIELVLAVLIIIALIFVPSMVGHAICADSVIPEEGYCYERVYYDIDYSNFNFWVAGFFPMAIGLVAILILGYLIKEVIISNYEKAYEQARKNLNGVES